VSYKLLKNTLSYASAAIKVKHMRSFRVHVGAESRIVTNSAAAVEAVNAAGEVAIAAAAEVAVASA
jgi:hypothetical protein